MTTQAEMLKEAQDTIKAMQAELERIANAGLQYATVVGVEGKFAIVSNGKGYTFTTNKDFQTGDQVLIHPQTGQIVQKTRAPILGDVTTVASVKDGVVTLNIKGETKIVAGGHLKGLKQGDRVLLDPNDTAIIHVVEKAKLGKPTSLAPVQWSDVGGHTEAKQLLREAIELPYKHPKIFKHYGKRQPKGILLYGDPGCGKTMLGRATATAIGADGAFISIKGPELLDPYVGVTEAAIRQAFRRAVDHKESTGSPAVIFVDEAEAILSTRGGRFSHMEKTIVPTFLTEMDGLEDNTAIVILSTNRQDMLDPAIIREGRIDYKVKIKRPDEVEAKAIFGIHMRGAPVTKGIERQYLVDYATGRLYGPHNGRAVPHSGALIAGVCDKAITHAIRRDITSGQMTGLCEQDFAWATEQVLKQEHLVGQA
jgi:proteasome-associated ATPase